MNRMTCISRAKPVIHSGGYPVNLCVGVCHRNTGTHTLYWTRCILQPSSRLHTETSTLSQTNFYPCRNSTTTVVQYTHYSNIFQSPKSLSRFKSVTELRVICGMLSSSRQLLLAQKTFKDRIPNKNICSSVRASDCEITTYVPLSS